ncbi:MAG: DUF4349 domain-containing protein [Phycisphaerales bacterium]|nr:DUF4349 domain-containing protein [Phycisphaerales bacterium]
MNTQPDTDPLTADLAALTRPAAGTSDLWRSALGARAGTRRSTARPRSGLLSTRIPGPLLAGCSLLLVLVIGVAMLPSLGKARSSRRLPPVMSAVSAAEQSVAYEYEGPSEPMWKRSSIRGFEGESLQPSSGASVGPAADPMPQDRHVIRKASLELTAADPRTAFAKAALLVSEASGEYVEASQITGDGPALRAQLTLRIAAGRLGSVLNELRALGTVVAENSTGEDVTEQAVDIDARLRNEQRVEQELLELLTSRTDAPLKEILDLREHLAQIRARIEQLTAQRDRLGRLVSLATVLVIVTPADAAPPEEPSHSIGNFFLERVGNAWSDGLRARAGSVAWLIEVALSGLIVWLALLLAALAIVMGYKRLARAAAAEPAPQI